MERYLYGIEIAYIGTNFAGWQRQTNARSVQGEIERGLRILLKNPNQTIAGASRTDSGVHAEGQFALFSTERGDLLERKEYFLKALNALTDAHVEISNIVLLPAGFRIRAHVRGKIYRYQIWNTPYPSCFVPHLSYHYRKSLDRGAMAEALSAFVGTHDFKTFSAAGSEVKTTVRTIHRAWMETAWDDRLIQLRFDGNGFLQHMVRIIVGTLVEVGRGAMTASEMKRIIEARNRDAAGPTAPPQGLILEKVIVDPEPVIWHPSEV